MPIAQPLAALPPYGCGIPLAGASARCWHYVEVIGNSEEVRSVVCLSAQLKNPLRRGFSPSVSFADSSLPEGAFGWCASQNLPLTREVARQSRDGRREKPKGRYLVTIKRQNFRIRRRGAHRAPAAGTFGFAANHIDTRAAARGRAVDDRPYGVEWNASEIRGGLG